MRRTNKNDPRMFSIIEGENSDGKKYKGTAKYEDRWWL